MAINPQDQFALLVEDCRLGWLRRPIAHKDRVRFEAFNPKLDLSDVPVFWVQGENIRPDLETLAEAMERLEQRTLHLPYPRCAFFTLMPGDHPGILDPKFRIDHLYVILIEEDDDGLFLMPFMKHETHDHWARQVFDLFIPFGANDIITSIDPSWGLYPDDFLMGVHNSLVSRIELLLCDLHKLTSVTGQAKPAPSGKTADRINQRRDKLGLPGIAPMRIIDLNAPPPEERGKPGPTGVTRRPHWRRGTWRHYKSGKTIWVGPVAIHGGDGPPPWYELRQ